MTIIPVAQDLSIAKEQEFAKIQSELITERNFVPTAAQAAIARKSTKFLT
jgi:hypothetical protein